METIMTPHSKIWGRNPNPPGIDAYATVAKLQSDWP